MELGEQGEQKSVPGDDDAIFSSPQELAVALELHAAGVTLPAIPGPLKELRAQVEHIAPVSWSSPPSTSSPAAPTNRTARPTWMRPSRLLSYDEVRPLAQQTVVAELARAMRLFAVRHPLLHPGTEGTPAPHVRTRSVTIPAKTMRAVEELVGVEGVVQFIASALEPELRARALDWLVISHDPSVDFDEAP
ncbi:hypothetical protein M2271_002863 [Streptomyces sp. LBL]|nr:hypothetical protein [Streptomyces sp. LBL]